MADLDSLPTTKFLLQAPAPSREGLDSPPTPPALSHNVVHMFVARARESFASGGPSSGLNDSQGVHLGLLF